MAEQPTPTTLVEAIKENFHSVMSGEAFHDPETFLRRWAGTVAAVPAVLKGAAEKRAAEAEAARTAAAAQANGTAPTPGSSASQFEALDGVELDPTKPPAEPTNPNGPTNPAAG